MLVITAQNSRFSGWDFFSESEKSAVLCTTVQWNAVEIIEGVNSQR